jgi:hypothetical protein
MGLKTKIKAFAIFQEGKLIDDYGYTEIYLAKDLAIYHKEKRQKGLPKGMKLCIKKITISA